MAYRLLGYEDRAVADQSFRNDAIDGGEVGAGHRVIALYAMVLAPFVSFSLGQYRSTSTTTTTGNTTTTTDEDLAKKSLHEWILFGVRFAFMP